MPTLGGGHPNKQFQQVRQQDHLRLSLYPSVTLLNNTTVVTEHHRSSSSNWTGHLLTIYLSPVIHIPGIEDKILLFLASLYLNLIKPNNSLPINMFWPLSSHLSQTNHTNQLINQTISLSQSHFAQEKLNKSPSGIKSAWAPINRYSTVLIQFQYSSTCSHWEK